MEDFYNKEFKLRCLICGDEDSFEYNEDKSYIKCIRCNREYFGGIDELTRLNQDLIESELESFKEEIEDGVYKEIQDVFKGMKNFKLKL